MISYAGEESVTPGKGSANGRNNHRRFPRLLDTVYHHDHYHRDDRRESQLLGQLCRSVPRLRQRRPRSRFVGLVFVAKFLGVVGGGLSRRPCLCFCRPVLISAIKKSQQQPSPSGTSVSFRRPRFRRASLALAFASGLVDPIVCVVVNRDFWSSFRALVGLRRRQLLREAAKAFAEAAASGESAAAGGFAARKRFMSNGSGSSSDTQEWIVFRDRWNELQRAAANNNRIPSSVAAAAAAMRRSSAAERKTEPQKQLY